MGRTRPTFRRRPRLRIERTGPGRFRLHLPPEERAIIRRLLPQLRELVEEGDPSTRRLFPTAYVGDPDKEREYQELMRSDLVASRLAAIGVVETTLDDDAIGAGELERWMEAVNSLRLVIGTRLDVTEDLPHLPDDHPDGPALALYEYLGWLLEHAVEAMSADLHDAPGRP